MFKTIFELIFKYKKLVKYLFAGGTAAFVDLFCLFVFHDVLHIDVVISATIAFIIAFFVSFYLQKFWTFRNNTRGRIKQQMVVYFLVGAGNTGINAWGINLLVNEMHVWYLLAQVVLSGFIALYSFFIYNVFIFKDKKGEDKTLKQTKAEGGKINILIATGIYPPDIGGPATYSYNLSQELKNLGCETTIVAYGDFLEKNDGEDIHYVSRNKNILFRYLDYFLKVKKLSKQSDIVYILDLMSAGLPATIAAKLNEKPVVFRTGGDFLWEKAGQSGWTESPLVKYYDQKKGLSEKILLYFCKQILDLIDFIIFSTQFQADIYTKYYGLPEEKIKIVPNAIPEINIDNAGLVENKIIFAGRLICLKNLSRLLTAFANIADKNLNLLIYGDGPARTDLDAEIKELGLSGRVIIKNKIAQTELFKEIRKSLFFILPSLTEISPNLILECISIGKPVILTKENGFPKEITSHLILIDPLSLDDMTNKINFLLDVNNLKNYEESLKKIEIQKRSWRIIAEEHLAIYNKLI